jgi:hypothetical protein
MSHHTEPQAEDLRFDTFPDGRSRFVFASFKDLEDAMDAVRDLESRGYDREQLSVFMSTETRGRYLESHPEIVDQDGHVLVHEVELERERKTLEGAGAGGAIGGVIGAAAAAIAAIGTAIIIPPLGIAVAGPVAAALAGAGAGAAAGGLVGALVGSGMSQYRARQFERLVKDGRTIVGGRARTEAERTDLEDKLRRAGGNLVADEN